MDLFDAPEVAVQHRILATPAVLVNGQLVASGGVRERTLRDALAAATEARD